MGMVAIGAVVLLASMSKSRGLHRFVPPGLQRKWSVLFVLICSFFFGYCGYLVIQSARIDFPLEILISTIFLGGALFVFGIVNLTSHTLRQLKLLHEELETKVLDRTEALSRVNQSLTASQDELAGHARFLGSVINALSHPFYVIDADTYEIILANRAAGFNLSAARRTCYWLTHGKSEPCNGEEHPCSIAAIKELRQPVILEHLHLNEQGEERVVEVHGYPIFDQTGKLIQIIEYSIDITEKKIIEKDLVKARKLAEAASAAKSEFLANVSHEIRTPMNAIMGMAYLALQTELDQQQRDYIDKVYYSSEHLLEIIGDILDLSKIEAGQLQLSLVPFRLPALLNGIVATMEAHALQKGLAFTLTTSGDLSAMVRGDDLRLRQILLNLVSNAIKFTSTGSVTIRADVGDCDPQGQTLRLHCTVQDTGIGVAPEKLERIFNSFEQADNSHTREFGGTGLGLAICKQLAELMGGRIWVESVAGKGSSFHVELPLLCATGAEAPETTDEIVLAAHQQRPLLRLLLVDDNELNRDVARLMLAPYHQIVTAQHGKEALEKLAEHDIDVILMDVQMPVMDGLAATILIRELERGVKGQDVLPEALRETLARKLENGHLPIVAMTAHAMGEDRQRCFQAGMDRYISKPFQYANLCEVLASLPLGLRDPKIDRAVPLPAARTQTPLLAQVAGHLKASTNLLDEQIRLLIITAQDTVAMLLDQAEAATGNSDLAGLAATLHSLKGTLLQCGLEPLADQAEVLYLHARKGEAVDYAALLQILRHGLGDLLVQSPSTGIEEL